MQKRPDKASMRRLVSFALRGLGTLSSCAITPATAFRRNFTTCMTSSPIKQFSTTYETFSAGKIISGNYSNSVSWNTTLVEIVRLLCLIDSSFRIFLDDTLADGQHVKMNADYSFASLANDLLDHESSDRTDRYFNAGR